MLDGEGGYTVYGKLMPATDSLSLGALPIGLAHKLTLTRDVASGETVTWNHVAVSANNAAVEFRREMEAVFSENKK
jgi:predicted homoserine dehydrogenase-like protein